MSQATGNRQQATVEKPSPLAEKWAQRVLTEQGISPNWPGVVSIARAIDGAIADHEQNRRRA